MVVPVMLVVDMGVIVLDRLVRVDVLVQIEPDAFEGHYGAAMILQKQEQLAPAAEQFRAALEIQPSESCRRRPSEQMDSAF